MFDLNYLVLRTIKVTGASTSLQEILQVNHPPFLKINSVIEK